jgi:F0F1-type ATP synthase epsilon subunit
MDKKNKLLFVTVNSRKGKLYEGNAISITSFNKIGRFDVLGEHANFITLIEREVLIKKQDQTVEPIPLNNGVMRVLNNQVDVYVGIKK